MINRYVNEAPQTREIMIYEYEKVMNNHLKTTLKHFLKSGLRNPINLYTYLLIYIYVWVYVYI